MAELSTVAILQARTGSSRLPGKALADLGGKPMLERQIERLLRCKNFDKLVSVLFHEFFNLVVTVIVLDAPEVNLTLREVN